ncbi:chemotaxis protein CheB [Pontibacter sp. G13]|uniref:chemotaxis protein CheB n=1 Tax=Pontibacter sp. G13 TaxID=3074898 RepID=UPI00288AE981|nr:chemotaxis protein CheB [Pontibacter sp. G13]WNJ21100.1 chemotaxis protein CheB [Pontibacter sp. G13]
MSHSQKADFPIVGIGASAGGLKAIEELLAYLPSYTGMSFIIIQHLPRKFKSLMQEILSKDSGMPIVMAEEDMEIQPDHVYLIPAGSSLTLDERKIRLEELPESAGPRFVIDEFLHSLGDNAQDKSIAVILSGTGSDGSRGIQTVKDQGGLVIVQHPESAEFDGMPISSIDTKSVDMVLTPEEISKVLAQIGEVGIETFRQEKNLSEISDEDKLFQLEFVPILRLVQKYHQVDFTLYKPKTIRRRIEKHMAMLNITSFTKYYEYLVQQISRVEELYYELLIGVTDFFRDPLAYDALEEIVFPNLMKADAGHQDLRVWICGCSTGEEVYSISIALNEYANKHNISPKYTILATDINDKALAIASKGVYPASSLAHIPEEIRNKYFHFDEGQYEIRGFYRDKIIFARNDATMDPPFINLDFVICRNLLIYLDSPIQRRLLLNFHFGLKPGGFLWLGSSENVLDYKHSFTALDEKWKVFQAHGETPKARKYYNLAQMSKVRRTSGLPSASMLNKLDQVTYRNARVSYPKILLDRFAPVSVLIDDHFLLLYLTGGAGQFLHLPDMELKGDLLSMVSRPTVLVLRDSLRRFTQESGPFLYPDVPVSDNHPEMLRDISVERIDSMSDQNLYLIQWIEPNKADLEERKTIIQGPSLDSESYSIIRDLQKELVLAKEEVQNSLEELETTNEELQASNEELLAANEELQSTNEELQSVNEELYTVNSELQARNQELLDANSTIDNLLMGSQIGTLFLDNRLHIKFFTPQISEVIDLTDRDLGTSIEKFRLKWDYPHFQEDVIEVMDQGIQKEREIKGNRKAQHWLVRINPFIHKRKDIGGAIISIIDISKRVLAESALHKALNNQHQILDEIPFFISVLEPDGKIIYINQSGAQHQKEVVLHSNFLDYLDEPYKGLAKNALAQVSRADYHTKMKIESPWLDSKETMYRHTFIPRHNSSQSSTEILMVSQNIQQERFIPAESLETFTFYQQILDQPEIYTSIKNQDFKYVYANQSYQKLLETNVQGMIGASDFALLPEADAVKIREEDQQVLAEAKELHTFESFNLGGKQITLNVVKYPIVGSDGSPQIGTLAFPVKNGNGQHAEAQEALELAQLEMAKKAFEETQEENRYISQSFAEDLRNELRRADRITDKISREAEFDESAFSALQIQLNKMNQTLDGLITYSNLKISKVHKEWLDLKVLIEEVWAELIATHPEADAELIFRDLSPVWADLVMMRKILHNLLSNALKHRLGNNCRVEIGTYKEQNKDDLILFIKDNGVGMDPKQLEHIFEVFHRLHEGKASYGSGVGLSIVKKAVELQGGNIWVISQLGQGATFYLSIPPKPEH